MNPHSHDEKIIYTCICKNFDLSLYCGEYLLFSWSLHLSPLSITITPATLISVTSSSFGTIGPWVCSVKSSSENGSSVSVVVGTVVVTGSIRIKYILWETFHILNLTREGLQSLCWILKTSSRKTLLLNDKLYLHRTTLARNSDLQS